MRLETHSASNVHKDLVSAVGWNARGELYSCSDDKTVARWDANGDAAGKVRRDARRPTTRASTRRPRRRSRDISRRPVIPFNDSKVDSTPPTVPPPSHSG